MLMNVLKEICRHSESKKETNMELLKLDIDSFEEKIFKNGENCLVIFSRKTCKECKVIVPMLEELQESYTDDSFGFYRVDVEEQVPLYKRFPLKGVPSVLFFSKGEKIGKLAGMIDEDDVTEKIEELY